MDSTGNNEIIESTNAGLNWSSINIGSDGTGPHTDDHGVAFDANGKLIDGNDGGIWRLDNATIGSIQWTDLNTNLNTIQFEGIGLHPTDSTIALGGSQDNGTSRFTGNLGWTLTDGGDGGFVKFSQQNGNRVYHIAPIGSFGSTDFFRVSERRRCRPGPPRPHGLRRYQQPRTSTRRSSSIRATVTGSCSARTGSTRRPRGGEAG